MLYSINPPPQTSEMCLESLCGDKKSSQRNLLTTFHLVRQEKDINDKR